MADVLTLNVPEQLKAEWLPKVVSGEKMLDVANPAPPTGSDTTAISTRPVRQRDNYTSNVK
jgi:alkylation response protein AidB-like acyl-CoA dehydrogenase